jgi:Zn-finger nucleic acid-binding protein
MSKKIYGDIVLDVCKSCGGSWFDKEEVERYIKQKQHYNLY